MDKIVKIRLWVPDQEALKEILSAAKIKHGCGSSNRDADGRYMITLFAEAGEARKITSLGYRCELDEDYWKVLKQRQHEVSKKDRFKGGKIKPEGLGVKR